VKARKRPLFPSIVLGAVLLLLNLPILAVAINSLNAGDTVTDWTGVSLRWFGEIIGDDRIRAAFWNSVVIGLLATVVSVVIGVMTTLAARLLPKRAQTAFTLTTYARLILPEVVTAVGLYLLFSYLGIGFGVATVVVGHAVFASAYATAVIQARYAGSSDRYADAAVPASDSAAAGARAVRVGAAVVRILLRRRIEHDVPQRARYRDPADPDDGNDPPARNPRGQRHRGHGHDRDTRSGRTARRRDQRSVGRGYA